MTTTPKLGLLKPAPSDAVDVTAQLSNNYDVLDAAIGTVLCTSSTRPSAPFAGLPIRETDTGFSYIWDGTQWVFTTRGGATVCTSSTRPTNTFTGLIIYETDTTLLYVWTGAAWVLYPKGILICTSLTRPSSPVVGTLIYETDSFDLVICVATTPVWVVLERAYIYGGKDVVHSNTLTATPSTATTETLINNMDSGAIDLIANTRYLIRARWQAAVSGSPSTTYATPTVFQMRIRDTNVSGTIRAQQTLHVPATIATMNGELTALYETTAAENAKVWVFSAAKISAANGPVFTFQGGGAGMRLGMEVINLGHSGQLTQVTT